MKMTVNFFADYEQAVYFHPTLITTRNMKHRRHTKMYQVWRKENRPTVLSRGCTHAMIITKFGTISIKIQLILEQTIHGRIFLFSRFTSIVMRFVEWT